MLAAALPGASAATASAPVAVLAKRLLPAVVNISTTESDPTPQIAPETGPSSPFDRFFKDFFDHQQQGDNGQEPGEGQDDDDGPPEPGHGKAQALGSGFVIDPLGFIVTNNHVIDKADEITVILQDDTRLKAELVGRDRETDLALLRVKPDKPLPSVTFGDSDRVRIGDWVVAVGNPYGLGGTVTSGIVSGRGRQIGDGGPYDDFLQTDAAINRGNSGGPLFDMDGTVIGVNSAIYSASGGSVGIGFAIPSDLVSRVIAALRSQGHVDRGTIGARYQSVAPEAAEALGLDQAHGVLIASVAADGPAAKGGVEPGDVVLAVNGHAIGDQRSFRRVILDQKPGEDVSLRLWRQRGPILATVRIGALPPDPVDAPKPAVFPAAIGSPVKALGLTLAPVSDDLRQRFKLDPNASVVVTGIEQTGPAADKGLKPGDVVVEMAQEAIKSLADVQRKVADAQKAGQKSVLMLIDRGGDLRFVALRIDRT